MSRIDQVYRSLVLNKFFTKGWGCPDSMRRLLEFRKVISRRDTCMELVDINHPVHIEKEYVSKDCRILEGHFTSPFAIHHPMIMPEPIKTAKFQVVLPVNWTGPHKPVCLHLAGTGDHGFWRRRTLMGRPLVKEAQIGSIILENPYYGCRKPKGQLRSSLQNVSDLFVMGGALILESIVLFNWCEKMGFGPLGITGISMGGHMASLAASIWPKPLTFVPCLSWSTASSVWTQGVLSGAVSWNELQAQYVKDEQLYKDELSALIKSPEEERWQPMFELGQAFAQNYPESVKEMEQIQKGNFLVEGLTTVKTSVLPVLGQVIDKITNKLNNPEIAKSREELKKYRLDSPNLPNKAISVEVIQFMRGVMDECTHLAHFDKPVDPSLIICVVAEQDAYIPRDRVMSLSDIWLGCEVRHIDEGHVTAFLFKQNVFRKAIIDSFTRQIQKYYNEPQNSTSQSEESSKKLDSEDLSLTHNELTKL